MMGKKLFYLVLLCIQVENFRSFAAVDVCKTEPRCRISRTHGMKSVDCFNKTLRTFPKCVANDAEVLELTFNRIRKVTKSDLSDFGYLKILYLRDNILVNLQNDTFEGMDDLIVLDLSQNSIRKLPSSVFNLPSLKKLYVRENFELNMAASIDEVRPIRSPLLMIDMSCTTDENVVTEFPDFGTMPYLSLLNISENQYHVLTPKHLAGLCSLETLVNANVVNDYEDDCDCWIINNWLIERKVQFKSFVCPISENDCGDRTVNEEDMATYIQCLGIINDIKKERLLTKVYIGVGVSILVVVLLIAFIYFCYIRNKRGKKAKTSKNTPKDSKLDGSLLLNNYSKTSENM